jgi:hypothetical protein
MRGMLEVTGLGEAFVRDNSAALQENFDKRDKKKHR